MSRRRIRCQYCIAPTRDKPNKLKQISFQNLCPFLWLWKVFLINFFYFYKKKLIFANDGQELDSDTKSFFSLAVFYVLYLKSKPVYLSGSLTGIQSKPCPWQMLGHKKSGDILCRFNPSLSFFHLVCFDLICLVFFVCLSGFWNSPGRINP